MLSLCESSDLQIDATTATNDTALSYAAENGHVDVCAVLLDAGAVIVRLHPSFPPFGLSSPSWNRVLAGS